MNDKTLKTPRDIPSVEIAAARPNITAAGEGLPRPLIIETVRGIIAEIKKELGKSYAELKNDEFENRIITELRALRRQKITRVINAAGILVHTNLGRAPLAEALFERIKGQVTGYSNLEFDLAKGDRGRRGELAEKYLALLAQSEAGTIVNNNAAALFIILNTLANRRKVVISRGELVQIGGGFRIPDIIHRAGAKILEVGTTNITSLNDYRAALEEKPALILKVHQSNFALKGFTDSVDNKELVRLGREFDIPVVNDLGSGVLIDTRRFIAHHEPTVQESVRDGAALTCFSGDKLLGGMQAGLIVGARDLIKRIKRNPVYRIIRVDKTVFSALEELLGYYLDNTWEENIKLWRLAARPESELYQWGHEILAALGGSDKISLTASQGMMGGGSLPEVPMASVALIFDNGLSSSRLSTLFREQTPPIIGRISDNRFLLDLRAVDKEDTDLLVAAIKAVLSQF